MLVALVISYERGPTEAVMPGFGDSAIDVAIRAGIFPESIRGSDDLTRFRDGDQIAAYDGVTIGDVHAAMRLLHDRGLVEPIHEQDFERTWIPTADGLDQAHLLMRPWWKKAMEGLKGDARTITVSVITTLIATTLTTLVLKAVGWLA